jgi:hypothetical protein
MQAGEDGGVISVLFGCTAFSEGEKSLHEVAFLNALVKTKK